MPLFNIGLGPGGNTRAAAVYAVNGPDLTLEDGLATPEDIHAFRNTGTSAGNAAQSLAYDPVMDYWVINRNALSDTVSVVSRFRASGPYGQVAIDTQNASDKIGHQGLSVAPDGKYLATSRTDKRSVLRFTYVGGGDPTDLERITVFDGSFSAASCCPIISEDGLYLIVSGAKDDVRYKKAFLLSGITWGTEVSPTDMTATTPAWQITFPYFDDFLDGEDPDDSEDYPFQSHAHNEGKIVALAGYGYDGFPPKLKAFNTPGGGEATRALTFPASYMFPDQDVTAGNLNEPEGIEYKTNPMVGQRQAAIVFASGIISERFNRIFAPRVRRAIIDLSDYQTALIAAIGSTPSAGELASLLDFRRGILLDRLDRYASMVYIPAGESEAVCKVNLADPGYFGLTANGTAGAFASTGTGSNVVWTGNGTDRSLSVDGRTWATLPHYHRDFAWIWSYLVDNVAETPAVVSGVSGNYTYFSPRNSVDNFSTRSNFGTGDAANQTVANTDSRGLCSMCRLGRSSYTVRARGVELASHAVASASFVTGVPAGGRSASTFTTRRLPGFGFGYPPPDAEEARFIAHLAARLAYVGLSY